jgi:uncharacterized protein YqeY
MAERHSPFCFFWWGQMTLKERINEDMKSALRAKDAPRLSAIRLLLAAIKQREVDERKELSDGEVVVVTEKLLKQRRESIAQYRKANRPDLVQAEEFEARVLEAYMPQALPEAEIEAAVAAAIASTDAKGPADMGKVMALLKAQLAGRADLGKVSALVRAKLGA